MARLIVLRGDSPDREIELTGRTIRIGRSPDNDLILEDGGKSVSRNHAEIRYENGRYVLVDLKSQNGVWVSGSRSPSVVLDPNVVASVGPFRLMIDSTVASPAPAPEMTTYGAPTMESGRTTAGSAVQAPAASAQSSRIPRTDQGKSQIKPTKANWFTRQPKWLLGGIGAAVVVVAALALGIRLLGGRQAPPAPDPLDSIATRIGNGDCAAALIDLQAVLASNPAAPRALELKSQAEQCATPPPPAAPAPNPMAERLRSAEELLASGDCSRALTEQINPALEMDPTSVEAAALKTRAEQACKQPVGRGRQPAPVVAKPDPSAQLAEAVPPESGGLPLLNGELAKDYRARVEAMRARYVDATAALSANDARRALVLFDAIVRDAGPKYLDASARLADAKNRQDAGQKSLQAGRDLESKGDWNGAIEAFRRARQTDTSINIDEAISRLTGKKVAAGKQACDAANVRYSYGRNEEALQGYQEAVKLLPPDDACVTTAKERFPQLRR